MPRLAPSLSLVATTDRRWRVRVRVRAIARRRARARVRGLFLSATERARACVRVCACGCGRFVNTSSDYAHPPTSTRDSAGAPVLEVPLAAGLGVVRSRSRSRSTRCCADSASFGCVLRGLGLAFVCVFVCVCVCVCGCMRTLTSARACSFECTQVSPNFDLVRGLVDGGDLYGGEA